MEPYIRSTGSFTVYYDALQEGRWIQSLVPELSKATLAPILQEGQNESDVDQLIAYDRPDIIIVYDGRPILVLERTEEVPSGHNVGQRFARIARASEKKVPFVYFFPYVAQKHGAETEERELQQKTNQRYVNPRLFEAFDRLEAIYGTVIIPVTWPVDSGYELLRTAQKDVEVTAVLRDIVNWAFSGEPTASLRNMNAITRAKEEAEREKQVRKASTVKYSRLPPTVRVEMTSELVERHGIRSNLGARLSRREKSLVYSIGMRYVRSDPYTGMLIFYDYLCTRTGPTTKERSMNLVARMPFIKMTEWNRLSDNNERRKDIRLFKNFADCILLGDAALI